MQSGEGQRTETSMSDANGAAAGIPVARTLTLELARVTERAAIAAARLRGQGKEKEADQAAVDAMRRELNALPIDGTVVIGEGERDEAPMLFIGERLGTGEGPSVDIAVDPLEGTTLCAKDMPGAIAVMAMAQAGSLLAAPDVYMQKIAIGPGYPAGLVDLDASPRRQHRGTGESQGRRPLADHGDHPRPAAPRRPGRRRTRDGCGHPPDLRRRHRRHHLHDEPDETGVDIYLGIGAAPEGVIAAGALRCIGGQMQGRLILDSHDKRERAAAMGIRDPNRKYELTDMARGDVIVAATGVTDGALLRGVRFKPGMIETETVVYRSATGTVRRILGEHRRPGRSQG